MLKDPLTIAKFGYVWMFQHIDKDSFGKVILNLFSETENLLNEFLKDNKISKEMVGFRPDS